MDRFDYTSVQGNPEIVLRTELLNERLTYFSRGGQPRILEVGVGSGDVTLMLARHFKEVTCIDSNRDNCNIVKERLKGQGFQHVEFICSKIEEAELFEGCYHHIILQGVLEHLIDPIKVLLRLKSYLYPTGYIHITVNFANSLHRWLGVMMGQIGDTEELAESDILLGHYRVYTPRMLKEHIAAAGLKITYENPFYLKPLPTSMLANLSMEIHRGLYLLGQKFPAFASYIYIEVTK